MNQSKSQNQWIAGLSSFVIHVFLLLILAVFTLAGSEGGGRGLSLDTGSSPADSDVIESVTVEANGDDLASPSSFSSEEISNSVLLSDVLPIIDSIQGNLPQFSMTVSDSVRIAAGQSKVTSQSFVSSSFEGRSAKNRASTGQANGASPASEAAVELALDYFARHQRPNGSWTMRYEDGPCNGECDHGTLELDPHEIAATGLALLCFLGAGHTMQEGQYSENVNKGIYFLVQNLKQRQTGVSKSEMYEHGIATLALCEALQMNGDAELLTKPCQEAINFIAYAQDPGGGWNYTPRTGSGDLSIVSWQVMALKSAVSAKLPINPGTVRGVDAFLKQQSRGEFMFVYRSGTVPTNSMTAIGTLLRIYRGWSRTDPSIVKGIEYLNNKGPSKMDLYYDYYATQAIFQFGDKPWKLWNPRMRDYLVYSQVKEGHMAGSWWFPGDDTTSKIANTVGGRIYVTALACLTLEVYYRYLPVYDTVTTEFQF